LALCPEVMVTLITFLVAGNLLIAGAFSCIAMLAE
jgi:hypothetical protein